MIYFDHAATTPVKTEVLESMLPFFQDDFANANSVHQSGQSARNALDYSRLMVAGILGVSPHEIVFTSGGTESNNLAIQGMLSSFPSGHIILSSFEHPSVTETIKQYIQNHPSFSVSFIDPNNKGFIDPKDIQEALQKDTRLICCMYANNEIGTIQAITKIGRIAEDANIAFHCDAVQAGALELDMKKLKVSSLSLSGHKIYGPKGVGVLYIKKGLPLVPLINGGGQEHRRRSGTENIPGIVGFAKALECMQNNKDLYNKNIRDLRDFFITTLTQKIPHVSINGDMVQRLPNNINICFPGVSAESLLLRLDMKDICVSMGSACSSGSLEASDTLLAIGLTKEDALSSLRFSLGSMNTKEEVQECVSLLVSLVKELRTFS
jgi:cysteine desulfurase